MKYTLVGPITKDEIMKAIHAYIESNQGWRMPAYILVHPETRFNFLSTIEDHTPISFFHYSPPDKEKGLRTTEKVRDLWLIKSEDIEPGVILICG